MRLEPERAAHFGFDRRRQMRERPDRTRQLAHARDGLRPAQSLAVPADLGEPEGELQAERHRLGVHAVRPADHRRAAVLHRPVPDRRRQVVDVRQDESHACASAELARCQ